MNQVRCLCVCTGCLVSGGDDNFIRVWEVGSTVKTMCFQRNASILALTSVPRSQDALDAPTDKAIPEVLWSGDGEGMLSIYDLLEAKQVASVAGHSGPVCSILFEHGYVFSSSVDKTVKVWSPISQTCLQTLDSHTSWVAGLVRVAISTQIRLWSFGGDKKICSWSMECSCPGVEESERLSEKLQQQASLMVQLREEHKATKRSLKAKQEEVGRLYADFETRHAQWSKTSQHQCDEIERLSSALAANSETLANVMQDLQESKADLSSLENERETFQRKLEQDGLAWGLASKLADANNDIRGMSNEIRQLKTELQGLQGKCTTSQQDLFQCRQDSESLKEQLADAKHASASAEQRCKALEEQLAAQSLKILQLSERNGASEKRIKEPGFDTVRDPCEFLLQENRTPDTPA